MKVVWITFAEKVLAEYFLPELRFAYCGKNLQKSPKLRPTKFLCHMVVSNLLLMCKYIINPSLGSPITRLYNRLLRSLWRKMLHGCKFNDLCECFRAEQPPTSSRGLSGLMIYLRVMYQTQKTVQIPNKRELKIQRIAEYFGRTSNFTFSAMHQMHVSKT